MVMANDLSVIAKRRGGRDSRKWSRWNRGKLCAPIEPHYPKAGKPPEWNGLRILEAPPPSRPSGGRSTVRSVVMREFVGMTWGRIARMR